jgi:hypothetical protein
MHRPEVSLSLPGGGSATVAAVSNGSGPRVLVRILDPQGRLYAALDLSPAAAATFASLLDSTARGIELGVDLAHSGDN